MNYRKNAKSKIGALLVGAVALAGCYLPRRDEPCHDLHEPKSQIEQKIINTPTRIIYNTPVRIEYNNAGRDVNVLKRTEEREPKMEMIGDSAGKVVYAGVIDGNEILYKEGVVSREFGVPYNYMRVRIEGEEYELYDLKDAHSISNDSWKDNGLERININREFRGSYDVDEINSRTEKGRKVYRLFEEGDKVYNDSRTAIRERLIGDRGKEVDDKDFERALKSFDELKDDKKELKYF